MRTLPNNMNESHVYDNNREADQNMSARRLFQLDIVSATDAGSIRTHNEDNLAADRELGLLMLADGMGGYKAGDVASAIATGLMVDYLKPFLLDKEASSSLYGSEAVEVQAITDAIAKTNLAIFKTAQTNTQYNGMGTTLVLMMLRQNRVLVAHVGDSRLYRLRHGRLELLTQDHSLLQEQVELGLISSEHARVSHNRNLVSRALGVHEKIEADIAEHEVHADDVYLLCSDGLNDMVDDADIELALNELQINLPLAANQLIQMAIDNGGHDNVSVLIAKVQPERNDWQARCSRFIEGFKTRMNSAWQN